MIAADTSSSVLDNFCGAGLIAMIIVVLFFLLISIGSIYLYYLLIKHAVTQGIIEAVEQLGSKNKE